MAQDWFRGTGSREKYRLGLGLLLLLCFLAPALAAAPPDDSTKPTAAQPSKKQVLRETLLRAHAFASQRQYDQAIAAYREYLAGQPQDDNAKAALARVLTIQGNLEEAEGLYESLLSRRPENIDYLLRLAWVESLQHKSAEAQILYERVLHKAPGNLEAKRGLADALLGSGQLALALQLYHALYAATKTPDVAERIRQVTAELESSPALAAAPEAAPTPVPLSPEQLLLEQARTLEAAQRYDDAVEAYRKYLKTNPEDDEVHRSLARLFFSQGQYREAISAYQTILSRHPSDADVLVALGKIAFQQKKVSDGRWYYEAALRADPSNAEAKRGLGDFYYWYSNYPLALRYYKEAFRTTHDPAIGQLIEGILTQQVTSPRAPVGAIPEKPILPFRDYLKIGYSQYAYTQNVQEERDGLLEIATPWNERTFVARMELMNRFGFKDIPIRADLYSPLWHKAWGDLTLSVAANPNFVPNVRMGGQIFQELGVLHRSLSVLEASLGYERLFYSYRANTSSTLFIPSQTVNVLTPSLTVYLPFNAWLTEKVIYIPDTGSTTLSSQLTWRPTDRLQLFASGAFGTSGERIYAFQDFTRATTRSYQGGAIFPITERLSGEFVGFYEDRGFLYIRRGGTFNLIWHW